MNVSQQSPQRPSSERPSRAPAPIASPTQYADPLEQRDPWRTFWNFATSDALLITLAVLTAIALLLAIILPQAPAEGTAAPVAYGQWQSQARAATGNLYSLLASLGLFDMLRSAGFKLLLAFLAGVALLRLANDAARMRLANMPADVLRDELRLRVTDRALNIAQLAEQLRGLRYRVITSSPQIATVGAPADAPVEPSFSGQSEWVHANRAPFAEALSALFHAGILISLLGALLNYWLGWQSLYTSLTPDQPTALTSNLSLNLLTTSTAQTDTLTLQLQPSGAQAQLQANQRANLDGIEITLRQVTPGLRVSAVQNGTPVTVTVSNYSAGRRDALLSFAANDRERAFVLPAAALLAQVVISSEDALGTGRLQAFALGSGELITDTPLRPQVVISDTTLTFSPDSGALIDALYRPGTAWVWLGMALAALGLIGTLVYPVQRLVIRHHGHWTEFYGSGPQVRRTVAKLLSSANSTTSQG